MQDWRDKTQGWRDFCASVETVTGGIAAFLQTGDPILEFLKKLDEWLAPVRINLDTIQTILRWLKDIGTINLGLHFDVTGITGVVERLLGLTNTNSSTPVSTMPSYDSGVGGPTRPSTPAKTPATGGKSPVQYENGQIIVPATTYVLNVNSIESTGNIIADFQTMRILGGA